MRTIIKLSAQGACVLSALTMFVSCSASPGYEFLSEKPKGSKSSSEGSTIKRHELTEVEASVIADRFASRFFAIDCGGVRLKEENNHEWAFTILQGYAVKEVGTVHVQKKSGLCTISSD